MKHGIITFLVSLLLFAACSGGSATSPSVPDISEDKVDSCPANIPLDNSGKPLDAFYTGTGSAKVEGGEIVGQAKNEALQRARTELAKSIDLKITSQCEYITARIGQDDRKEFYCKDQFHTDIEFVKEDYKLESYDPENCEFSVTLYWLDKRVDSILSHDTAEKLHQASFERETGLNRRKAFAREALSLIDRIDYSLLGKPVDKDFIVSKYQNRLDTLEEAGKEKNRLILVLVSNERIPPESEEELAKNIAGKGSTTFTVNQPFCHELKVCLEIGKTNGAETIGVVEYNVKLKKKSGFWSGSFNVVIRTYSTDGSDLSELSNLKSRTVLNRKKNKLNWRKYIVDFTDKNNTLLRDYFK